MSSHEHRLKVTLGHIAQSGIQLAMSASGSNPPLTTHILDTAKGLPAGNVPIILYIQDTHGCFTELERSTTNSDGRSGFLAGSNKWGSNVYKLHFDTQAYFSAQQQTGFYPYVDVVFRIDSPSQHYHVPILLSPYGYSTYRGS